MLISNLYTIKSSALIDDTLTSVITINPNNNIFDGHFPENPVLPGVVQLQIIKELLEKEFNKSLILTNGANIKYTSIIVPKKDEELQIKIGLTFIEDRIKVNTIINNTNTTFLKFKGTYNYL